MIKNYDDLAKDEAHSLILDALTHGIEAAHPKTVIEQSVHVDGDILTVADTDYDLTQYEHIYVVGGGNAAGAVGVALERKLGEIIETGTIVTDETVPTERITVYEGSHPLPDEEGQEGANQILEVAKEAGADDLVLAVVTGGGSAHLAHPVDDVPLSDLRAVTEELLASGAEIQDINTVRKHLSKIKGGQLAVAAAPATVCGIVFSDVIGDRLDTIASGPISPDDSTYEDALRIVNGLEGTCPPSVVEHLERGAAGEQSETPTAAHAAFETVDTHIVANNRTAIDAVLDSVRDRGYEPVVLSSRVRGEAQEVAKDHIAIAEECAMSGTPFEPPVALISGGETTVTLDGDRDGEGGPNQEFVLSAAVELATTELSTNVRIGCIDTDGIDGATPVAGAIADELTVGNLDRAREALATNNSYPYLLEKDCTLLTGDTGVNVNDLRVILIE